MYAIRARVHTVRGRVDGCVSVHGMGVRDGHEVTRNREGDPTYSTIHKLCNELANKKEQRKRIR